MKLSSKYKAQLLLDALDNDINITQYAKAYIASSINRDRLEDDDLNDYDFDLSDPKNVICNVMQFPANQTITYQIDYDQDGSHYNFNDLTEDQLYEKLFTILHQN